MEGGGIGPGLGPASAGVPSLQGRLAQQDASGGCPHLLMPAACPAGTKCHLFNSLLCHLHFAEQVSTVLVPFSHRGK